MKNDLETRQKVLDGALRVFKKIGHKFTMDDLAKDLSMSKKTIYKIFKDKSEMLYALIEYIFDEIKAEEQRVYKDDTLDSDEKFIKILGIIPDKFYDVEFSKVYAFSEKFPDHYKRLRQKLENGWETTWLILDDAVEKGYFRKINKNVFMMTYSAALERFLDSDELDKSGITYFEAIDELVLMLVSGIRLRKK